ncbi:MAG: hypothetical protein AB7C95_00715 [Synergistaceae bacterium]
MLKKMTPNQAMADYLSEITGTEYRKFSKMAAAQRTKALDETMGKTEDEIFQLLFDDFGYSNEQIGELCHASLAQLWRECEDALTARSNGETATGDKEEKFVLRKSEMEGACALVHQIANSMPNARRKDVIAACVAQGIATNTARTQYQRWYKSRQEGSVEPTEPTA